MSGWGTMPDKIAIIDYGVGNLFSLQSSFSAIGEQAQVTEDPAAVAAASRLLLPGVGAFADAAARLRASGMDRALLEALDRGATLLGVCLGMQLLFDESFEYGRHAGLGLIPGAVRPIAERIPPELKIPHIGWNALRFPRESPLFRHIREGDHVYFVHSYAAVDCDDSVIATTDYGATLTAAVQRGRVFGCQFHPEKSGDVGLRILKAFCELEAAPC